MQIIQMNPLSGSGARLTGYLHERIDDPRCPDMRPCVVICPGGGYAHVSPREGEPVAMRFFTAGCQAFVLTYTVFDTQGPAAQPLGLLPLRELAAAVAVVRAHSGEWHVDPGQVTVCGFSAGGHLAASLGTLWNHERLAAQASRPDALVLCYPVITSGPFGHRGSLDHLAGSDPALRALFSLENQVCAQTPPTFLWHTADDSAVPVQNSLLFQNALLAAGVPFESHVFASGAHGLSLCNEEVGTPNPACAPWMDLCLTWLRGVQRFYHN